MSKCFKMVKWNHSEDCNNNETDYGVRSLCLVVLDRFQYLKIVYELWKNDLDILSIWFTNLIYIF